MKSETVLQELQAGKSMQDIGDDLGVTRQRVHQVLTPEDRKVWKECSRRISEERKRAAREKRETFRARRWVSKPAGRFWEGVDIQGFDDCWEWVGARYPQGYGRIHRWGTDNRNSYTHRVAWELVNGTIPDGMCVCHHCDNPPCCNPRHLFLGTQNDNIQDSIKKGRR